MVVTPVAEQRPIMRGGLAEPGKFPPFCRHQYGKKVRHDPVAIDRDALELLSAQVGTPFVYGGMMGGHFGHFIAEHVHRLWIVGLPEFQNATVVYTSDNPDRKPPKFFLDAMHYFGVRDWVVLDKPTRIERLTIAESGKVLKRPQAADYDTHLQRIAANHTLKNPAKPEKVAILRGHLTKGRLLGELALESFLEREGYVAYRPEDHSLMDQLSTIASAKKIVISDGSSCHLFDLLPKLGCDVAFLARRPGAQLDRNSLEGKVARLASFKDVSIVGRPWRPDGTFKKNAGLGFAPPEAIVAFLREHGFISRKAAPMDPVPYFEDFRTYARLRMVGEDKSILPRDIIVESLVRQIHEKDAQITALEKQARTRGLKGVVRALFGWLRKITA